MVLLTLEPVPKAPAAPGDVVLCPRTNAALWTPSAVNSLTPQRHSFAFVPRPNTNTAWAARSFTAGRAGQSLPRRAAEGRAGGSWQKRSWWGFTEHKTKQHGLFSRARLVKLDSWHRRWVCCPPSPTSYLFSCLWVPPQEFTVEMKRGGSGPSFYWFIFSAVCFLRLLLANPFLFLASFWLLLAVFP